MSSMFGDCFLVLLRQSELNRKGLDIEILKRNLREFQTVGISHDGVETVQVI